MIVEAFPEAAANANKKTELEKDLSSTAGKQQEFNDIVLTFEDEENKGRPSGSSQEISRRR